MMNNIGNQKSIILKSEQALLDFVQERAKTKPEKALSVICAGHFMLMPDKNKNKLIPGIFEKEHDEYYINAQNTIGLFPQYTWKIGCTILERLKKQGNAGLLSLLINDWQLVPIDLERENSQPNKFREMFYAEFKTLPEIYHRELSLHGLNFPEDMYKTEEEEFYLREVRLRDRFLRKVKNIVANDNKSIPIGMCSLNLDECGNIILNTEDDASYALTTNSKVGCAGGVSQMILDIAHRLKSGYAKINFINLMPNGCTIPVNVASELAVNILSDEFNSPTINITNIYFDGYGTEKDEDFYQRGIPCYRF